MSGCISVVVPVYNEAENIQPFLRELSAALTPPNSPAEPHEIVLVYDFPEDSTLPAVAAMQPPIETVRLVRNELGKGVLNALRAGLQSAAGDVIIIMMADRSDDPRDVPTLARLIRDGADVAVASRYCRGGRQEGGPFIKGCLSRMAGESLYYFARLPVHDATNNFRAYSRRVVEQFPIESQAGFSVALELTVKAHAQGWRIAEIPTTWKDRTAGQSRFKLVSWLPHYLKWYRYAFWQAWFGRRRSLTTS